MTMDELWLLNVSASSVEKCMKCNNVHTYWLLHSGDEYFIVKKTLNSMLTVFVCMFNCSLYTLNMVSIFLSINQTSIQYLAWHLSTKFNKMEATVQELSCNKQAEKQTGKNLVEWKLGPYFDRSAHSFSSFS